MERAPFCNTNPNGPEHSNTFRSIKMEAMIGRLQRYINPLLLVLGTH